MGQPTGKKRIAVLGGGGSALAAVFALTEQPDWQERFDITVYQVGWRLGGKGASGRNRKHHDRIEEHGVHVFFGFYDNAFRVIRKCYRELVERGLRKPDDPLGTWEQAFSPHGFMGSFQPGVKGGWVTWTVNPATDFKNWPHDAEHGQLPGDPDETGKEPLLWDHVREIMRWMLARYTDSQHFEEPQADPEQQRQADIHPTFLQRIRDRIRSEELNFENAAASGLLNIAVQFAHHCPDDPTHHDPHDHGAIVQLLERFMAWLWSDLEPQLEAHDETSRLLIEMELAFAIIHGILEDGVLIHGFCVIDDIDFRDWLKKHLQSLPGNHDHAIDSGTIRSFYDLVFGFLQGDYWEPGHPGQPSIAAGTTLQSLMRIIFTYKGAMYWKMEAGMGDVVFGPLYQVLKARGVQFRFFHRVENLGLSDDKTSIASITVGRQVTLRGGEYDPLYRVKGLPCWPSEPLWEQIEDSEAAELQRGAINLESSWSPWENREEIVLHAGRDFDLVILGIAIGAFPYICKELIHARKEWRDMVEQVKTVRTLAFQLWLNSTPSELGWKQEVGGIMAGYVEPFDTWADMSHLLDRENWSAGPDAPQNIAYFCGPMRDDDEDSGFENHSYPNEKEDQIRDAAIAWLEKNMRWLWPGATSDKNPEGLNWSLLAGAEDKEGPQRFSSQYWRANIEPWERYVLSVPNSGKYRLRPDRSGFANLYLTGDWTDNVLNVGAFEAAMMSGLQAARAVDGRPRNIVGESYAGLHPSSHSH